MSIPIACALLPLVACGGAEPDSAGGHDAPYAQWSLGDRTGSIGGIDAPPGSELSRVVQVIPVGEDSVLVTDSAFRSVLLFDRTGALLRSFGRPGPGPDEFSEISAISRFGDTLRVVDRSRARLHLISITGTAHASRSLPESTIVVRQTERSLLRRRWVTDPPNLVSGLRVAQAPASALPPGSSIEGQQATGHFVAIFDSLGVRDALEWISPGAAAGARLLFGTPPTNFHIAAADPFPDGPILQIAADGLGFVLVERPVFSDSGSARFRVTRWAADGSRAYRIEVPYRPVPIPESVLDSVIEERTRKLEASGFALGAAARQLSADSLRAPRFFPPVSSVVLGADGMVWIGREGLTTPFQGARRYDAIAPEGTPGGTISLPAPGMLAAATSNGFWVIEYDAYDTPTLAYYPVVR